MFDHIAPSTKSSSANADTRALVRLLASDDWQARRSAVETIVQQVRSHSSNVHLEELLEELMIAISGDGAPAGHRAAAIAVLEGIGAAAQPRIEAALKQAAQPAVRIALAGLIGTSGGARAVALLAPLARDADTNVAAAAIAALGHTRDVTATPILLQQTASANEWLRFAAIGALGELGDARAVPKLEELLEEPLMQETAATALVEICTIDSVMALARHLRAKDKSLRVAVLTALVSLACDERPAVPRAVAETMHAEAQRALRAVADEATFADLARIASSGERESAGIGLIALGWLGDARAVPFIARFLATPSLEAVARRALADLSHEPQALGALLGAQPHALAPLDVALAISNTRTLASIEAAARLSVEAVDVETFEACRAALANMRAWMRSLTSDQVETSDAARVYDNLRQLLLMADGDSLIEIAFILGVLAAFVSPTLVKDVDQELSLHQGDDGILAHLAFLQNSLPARAFAEARRAQRHPSAPVRLSAIEILGEQKASTEIIALASHLTDESISVRRAGVRALRRGTATRETSRALIASLADEDIWVTAETILTLGALFGSDAEVRALLREALNAPHPLCRVAAAQALTSAPAAIISGRESSAAAMADSAAADFRASAAAEDWRALSQMARRDAQAEVRRAAALAFAHCAQPRQMLSVMRAALKDAAWPVRRAAIDVLADCVETGAHKLLLDAATADEEPTVRGAALRGLAKHGARETLSLACQALSEAEPKLVEDAFAALLSLKRTCAKEMLDASTMCAPRAAAIIKFALADEAQALNP